LAAVPDEAAGLAAGLAAALAAELAAALAAGLAAELAEALGLAALAAGLALFVEEPHAKRPNAKARVIRIARIFFIYLVLLLKCCHI
jgi:hypothetical protein